MKKTILIVMISITAFAFTYGAIAFVMMSSNPANWTNTLRAAFICYSLIITGMCLWVFLQEYESKK